ncbi:MAG: gas vesicle protein GvpG [Planctomycetota bacterium]|nr:gas vesicle protein GvpG [Planctomycetota bacterium]
MFLIDDLLMMPARGIMAAFREIHNAVQQDSANESESIRTELSELYMRLETKQLSEAEFEQREKELLDRLDEIEKGAAEAAVGIGGGGTDEEDFDEEGEADEDASEDEYFDGDEDDAEDELEDDAAGEDDDELDDEEDEDVE